MTEKNNITRRGFLGAFGAASAACLFPEAAYGHEGHDHGALSHSLGGLSDIATGAAFQPRAGAYGMVIFMTAQELYANCGGAFVGVASVMTYRQSTADIQPILVIPKVSDQQDPQDMRNLHRALGADPAFTILTGELPDVMQAAGNIHGAFYELDAQGKVSGHTLEAFFLTPSGKLLFHHPAEDSITYTGLVDRMVDSCALDSNRALCL